MSFTNERRASDYCIRSLKKLSVLLRQKKDSVFWLIKTSQAKLQRLPLADVSDPVSPTVSKEDGLVKRKQNCYQ